MPSPDQDLRARPTRSKMRSFSGLSHIGANAEMQLRDYKFAIPKLGHLASLNISRFVAEHPSESGWNVLVDELIAVAARNTTHKEARRVATSVLCKVAAETVAEVTDESVETRTIIQRRSLAVLLRTIDSIYAEYEELTAGDIEMQGHVVDALRAILERSGESLVGGWHRTVAILSSVFERSGKPPERQDDEEAYIDWDHISKELVAVSLGRTAFAATQLICSDFLSALPSAVMPALIELFHRFACQTEDLNISLTTITMAWNVSDFLLSSITHDELHAKAESAREAEDIEEELGATVRQSSSSQWLVLLLRLQDIIQTGEKEVRKAAFQTICSIFKNHGDQLTPMMWDLTLRRILFKIAANDVLAYEDEDEDDDDNKSQPSKDEPISNAIISGLSEILAQHLKVIEEVRHLSSLWEAFLSRLEAYLDVQHHALNTAVFKAMSTVVRRVDVGSKPWSGPMYRSLHLWLKRNPAETDASGPDSNQDAFTAYVEAGGELYRLTQQSMSITQTRALVENLYLIVRNSDGPKYGADISSLSPLQSKVFSLMKSVESDAPSTLVIVAAKMVTLHHETAGGARDNTKPTFIAISSESIDWLKDLMLQSKNDLDLLDDGSFVTGTQSLRQIVEQKYKFNLEHKGVALWRKATSASLNLAKPLLSLNNSSAVDPAMLNSLWTEYAGIASGIVNAAGLRSIPVNQKLFDDEDADMASFKQLRDVLVPRLGDDRLDDRARTTYIRALFDASIIHTTNPGCLNQYSASPIVELSKIRRGLVEQLLCSDREEMCYVCLSELVALTNAKARSEESAKLAQIAAPWLILRLALPIQAYIADQPLRGRRPQPLSELEELLKCFDIIKELQCAPDALPSNGRNVQWTGGRAHLQYLYPLLVKALAIASDRRCGSEEVLSPLQAVLAATASNFQ